MGVKIAVLREQAAGERRVAATPETVKKFIGLGAEMAVEEVALAERFAAELQARIERQSAGGEAPSTGAEPGRPAGAAPVRAGSGLPGMSAVPRNGAASPSPGAIPANSLPGTAGKVAP